MSLSGRQGPPQADGTRYEDIKNKIQAILHRFVIVQSIAKNLFLPFIQAKSEISPQYLNSLQSQSHIAIFSDAVNFLRCEKENDVSERLHFETTGFET